MSLQRKENNLRRAQARLDKVNKRSKQFQIEFVRSQQSNGKFKTKAYIVRGEKEHHGGHGILHRAVDLKYRVKGDKPSVTRTINSFQPMRYFFGKYFSDVSNYMTKLSITSITNTKRIYFRSITLFRDYIPYWYNKILRNMNLNNIQLGTMPSVLLFCNFVDVETFEEGKTTYKLKYFIQYKSKDNINDYNIISYFDKNYLKLELATEYLSSTFELCTNFRFMPLCEFATRIKMKYDPDRNYCVFISNCDLTELNALYCMEEKTPLTCLPNYYITADAEDNIYCSGNCIREEIRHPGNNQTQGICNSYCDKGTKQCPGTSSAFLKDYQLNYKCNENNYRVGYHCIGTQCLLRRF